MDILSWVFTFGVTDMGDLVFKKCTVVKGDLFLMPALCRGFYGTNG